MAAVVAAGCLAPLPALAECDCLCLDGTYRTVCTAANEVQASGGLCLGRALQGCPSDPQAPSPQAYPAPLDGVNNCRDARLYDASAGDYVAARVCDVVPQD
jgi:hypothetical protein